MKKTLSLALLALAIVAAPIFAASLESDLTSDRATTTHSSSPAHTTAHTTPATPTTHTTPAAHPTHPHPTPAPTPAPTPDTSIPLPQPQKDWTFAVYLNANNNLDPFSVDNINEMEAIGSGNWLNVVTLLARQKGTETYNYITKGAAHMIKDLGHYDMGDYKHFVEFAQYIVSNFPAKHYALVIWNHGSGWKLKDSIVTRGISYDDSTGNHITNQQLGMALHQVKDIIGHNIDIMCYDACLMQMAEVAYEAQGCVDYVVGSEETEPGKGTPYDAVLKAFCQSCPVQTNAKAWTKAYIDSYNHGSHGYEACTQSTLDISKVQAVFDAMNGFSKAAMAGNYVTEFGVALDKVQKYAYPENIDMIHFATLLKSQSKDEALTTACDKLIAAAQSCIIANGNMDPKMANSNGMSVYFPADSTGYEPQYTNLDICKTNMWPQMIQDYYKKKTASKIVKAVNNGDVTALRSFVNESKEPEVSKFVADQMNFQLHTEGAVPAAVFEEANSLVKQLTTRQSR
ncbi:MAG: hypothetical protein HQM09_04335 [Candidatus Riflebacteria bacterium]|nr:hypothetical protein [Candidatus Riflebacteria bacterium]